VSQGLRDWAFELIDSLAGICEVLDRGDASRPYTHALAVQAGKIGNAALTPSARLMTELATTNESFFELALRMSMMHKDYFLELYPPNQERQSEFANDALHSLQKQREIEASDKESFDIYLSRYFAK
jgi:glutamate--cysteine ligase